MANRFFVRALALYLAAFGLSSAADAAANYTKPGFAFPSDRKAIVLVAYPDVQMNRQGKGGEEIPSPEWTNQAQRNLQASMLSSKLPAIVELKFMTAEQAAASPAYSDLLAAYRQRTSEMIFKVPQGSPDVTKAKKCRCTYDFAEVKDRVAAAFGPADFVLFINQIDTYASSGQILGEIAGAMAGEMVAPGGAMRRTRYHAGNAILFDAKSGEVVWMHGDGAFGGDLRKPESAAVRVEQALSGFPGLKK